MSVLTRALRKIDPPPALPPEEVTELSLLDSVSIVIKSPTPTVEQTPVEPALVEAVPAPEGPLAGGTDDEPAAERQVAEPVATPWSEGRGEVILASDLTADGQAGGQLAAGLALEGRSELHDDVAVVSLSGEVGDGAGLSDAFIEANEPGLYARRFDIGRCPSDCRRLLVLVDECRRRFKRTVLVVNGADEAAISLAGPRVDDAVLLGAGDGAPEARLIRAENRLRAAARHFRPRLIVAA